MGRRPQHRIHSYTLGMTKRQIQKLIFVCLFGVWALVMIVHMFNDTCQGQWHTQLLCDEFEQGKIGGHLCHDLCETKTIYLSSCDRDGIGNLIFPVNYSTVIKTRDRSAKIGQSVATFSHVYKTPEGGTSMENFRKMIGQHIQDKLGDGDHHQLIQKLLDISDFNKDDKVSLAEAKTLWALLRQNDFLVTVILEKNYHTPSLKKYCGETYMVENLPLNKVLYQKPTSAFWSFLFPNLYTWGFPSWISRGKIAVGLLEFTLDIYQHQTDGAFYMCNLNQSNIGYTAKHDVVIQDLGMLLPKKTLQSYLMDAKCYSNANCRFTEHCTTVCDQASGSCTSELVQPNLSLICNILKPYILLDIPKAIRADCLNLLFRCISLDTTAADFDVQHSLILNDLKSLLWRQISADV